MDGHSRREKLRVRVHSEQEEREHFHQDIELIYVLEGTMDVKIGEQVTHMQQEDFIVVNANKKHGYTASNDILFAKLSITYQLVSDVFNNINIIFWCDSTKENNERYDELRMVMKKLLSHYLSTQGGVANFGHIGLCYRVMEILSLHFLVQSSDKVQMDEKDRFEERILQINNYIRAHYNQPINLKELSEKLYLSNSYLSRFFKKNYGMSFAEYLTNIRLYHAVDEILYSKVPITRIAYDNGFANVSVFNKSFKKAYGETPSLFRKKATEQKEKEVKKSELSKVEERLQQFLETEGNVVEKKQNYGIIQVKHQLGQEKPLIQYWNQMINVGSAEELLRSEVRDHIVLLHETLKFRYVRFWNVFSKQQLIDITREDDDYNFTRLDGIIDFLLQFGMRPHIELGQKPKRIHRNIQNLMLSRIPTSQFTSAEQWNRLVDAWMQHLLHRYGREEIDTWRIELWFEEDYRNLQQIEMYLERFQDTAEIIRKYSSELKFGGYGIRSDYQDERRDSVLQELAHLKYRPDFISMIYYAYNRGEMDNDRYSKRSTDNDGLRHGVEKVKMMMEKAGISDIPLYITEWNQTVSERNFMNDTCFKGAYIMKNVIDIYDQTDVLCYFMATDYISEYYDSNAILHGGVGLLSKESVFKPAAFAFDMLNRLHGSFVAKGAHYLITTDTHDTYGIVCHNQKRLNYNYYFTNEDEIDKENIWKYFEDRDGLTINICLSGVKDGTYQMKIYRVNEQSGSILGIWKEMEFNKKLTREDIKYFQRLCEPKLTMNKVEVTGGTANIEIQLTENEILFANLQKIL